MKEAVLVDYLRSPFSRSRPRQPDRDKFNQVRMDEVLAMLYKKLVERTGIDPKEIGDCITGCALGIKENWTYGGRTTVFLAGLPDTVPAHFVDRQCASSMTAAHNGAMEIMTGHVDIVLAGGMEHMTHVPMDPGSMMDAVSVSPQLMAQGSRMMETVSMGLTAEKLWREEKDNISKEDMDRWALRSHQLAAKALEEGYFKDEIMPIEAPQADGSIEVIDHDLSIRPDTTLEKIASLPPAFTEIAEMAGVKIDGVITAGNSSPLNAGASAVMLMSKEKAKDYGLEPMATLKSFGWAAVDPTVMGRGPVPASKMALKKAGLEVKDIDFWEINEAFTVVTLNTIHKLGIDPDKVNIKGGATAIGHPLGATGTRLIGTLARILKLENARFGLATPCVGGGQGAATIIERE